MKAAAARMVLVGMTALAAYALALILVDHIPGADIRQPLAIGWTGAFCVAVVFAGWNVWDDLLDARAAYRRGRTSRIIAGGMWRLRSDMLQGACCTAMAGAGALAIVQWATAEVRTSIILAASVMLVANQIWNRVDRERLVRMPAAGDDARYHQARAEVRRLEADLALERANKHDALQEATRDKLRVGMLERLLVQYGIDVPPRVRTEPEETP